MTIEEYKEKKVQDPEFASAYEEIQPEMNILRRNLAHVEDASKDETDEILYEIDSLSDDDLKVSSRKIFIDKK